MNKQDIKDIGDTPDQGKFILFYGETGSGKSTSVFATAPYPLLYISTEPRNPKISLKASKREYKSGDISLYEYKNWASLMELLMDKDTCGKFRCIVLDSLSYLMNVRLKNDIEDEIYESQDEDKRAIKTIISSSKLSLEGWGGLASQMTRLVKALGSYTNIGIDVILTCLAIDHPRWDRELSSGPSLLGKEFPASLPGALDLIGYVRTRTDENNNLVFPPIVFFESPNGEYLSKYTGTRPTGVSLMKVPLDLNLILGVKNKK